MKWVHSVYDSQGNLIRFFDTVKGKNNYMASKAGPGWTSDWEPLSSVLNKIKQQTKNL